MILFWLRSRQNYDLAQIMILWESSHGSIASHIRPIRSQPVRYAPNQMPKRRRGNGWSRQTKRARTIKEETRTRVAAYRASLRRPLDIFKVRVCIIQLAQKMIIRSLFLYQFTYNLPVIPLKTLPAKTNKGNPTLYKPKPTMKGQTKMFKSGCYKCWDTPV